MSMSTIAVAIAPVHIKMIDDMQKVMQLNRSDIVRRAIEALHRIEITQKGRNDVSKN